MDNSVRESRAGRGLSQADLAAALGVSRQTVIAIESGRYSPSLPLAFRIAHYFGTTVDQMFDPAERRAPQGKAAQPVAAERAEAAGRCRTPAHASGPGADWGPIEARAATHARSTTTKEAR